jgi:hypothetical protein
VVLEHSPQSGLLKAELLFDHPKRIISFGVDFRSGCFDQIILPGVNQLPRRQPKASKSAQIASIQPSEFDAR